MSFSARSLWPPPDAMGDGLDDFSLFELFRMEAEEQVRVLQSELIQLESGAATAATLEALMRASHSLKGAARIVGLDTVVHLTHSMEDRFVAAQAGRALDSGEIDRMLAAVDWLARLQATAEAETAAWLEANQAAIEACAAGLSGSRETVSTPPEAPANHQMVQEKAGPAREQAPESVPVTLPAPSKSVSQNASEPDEDIFAPRSAQEPGRRERTVRIAADRFDRLLSLASETLIASRQLAAQNDELSRIHRDLGKALHALEEHSQAAGLRTPPEREMERHVARLANHIAEFDASGRANERTAEQLYRTVLAGRLRPFSEGITGVARLVRDTARELGKSVQLEVLGDRTRVDRDILERLEAPISHLVTNAIDHGIEAPGDRLAAGKPPEAHLRLHARHENGRLVITVADDGRGIHLEQLRQRIVRRNLVTAETAAGLSEAELYEFLFLPGFSTSEQVSAFSGRGVGLNVVQSVVQEASGSVTVTSDYGKGTAFRITLPITRSVVKVIRVQAEGELYAVPLVRIDLVANLEPTTFGERPTVRHGGQDVPVFVLGSLLGLSARSLPTGPAPLLFCGGVAFAVDRFVDEMELSVRGLDTRLGKIPGVSAASLDENGLPLLILDVEDLIQTALGRSDSDTPAPKGASATPHILIVDDSHTVREMQRRLLVRAGYSVSTAQNGQEAWNLLRLNDYDLLISDVDMPQMNGIELVSKIRENPRLASLPVIILSYKDREEDRRQGLDAGADFYLTKGNFKNDSFLQAVVDLIGTAEPLPSDPGGAA